MILKTLRSKLLVFSLLLSSLPMMLIFYFTYQSQKHELTQQVQQTLNIYSDNIALSIEELIEERVSDVKLLASNPVLRDPQSSPDERKKELQHFLDVHDIYLGNLFVNTDGIVTSDMENRFIGSNLSERKWFQETIEGGTYLSDVYQSSVVQRPVLVIASAVYDQSHHIIGVVATTFNLNLLWEKFDIFRDQQKNMGLNGHAFLMNGQGDIIAFPDDSYVLQENYLEKNNLSIDQVESFTDKGTIFSNDQEDTFNSITKLDKRVSIDHDWFVVVTVPKSEFYGTFDLLQQKYIILFSVMLLVTIPAVIKISNSIIQPVQRLVDVTNDFTKGRKIAPIPQVSYQEINQLNHTFYTMFHKLEEREKGHRKSTLILETTDNGVLSLHKQTGVITTFNHTCEKLFQLKKEDVLGKSVEDVVKECPEFHTFMKESLIWNTLQGGLSSCKHEFECELHQEEKCFFISISTLTSMDHECVDDILIIFNDLTDIKDMEKELIRSEKLKAVGELAAGFAHEIRNPITTIKGFLQMLNKRSTEKGIEDQHAHPFHHDVYPLLVQEIERVDHIVTELLQLAKEKCKKKESKIDQIVEEIVLLYESQAKEKGIEIHREYAEVLPAFVDAEKMKQVFMNMMRNAYEAMPKGGSLTIRIHPSRLEDTIQVVFEDTGVGMDEETLERLGTPFYTTKDNGTGLGLMTSYRIVEDMGGTITVHSEVNKGSTFLITLPLSQKRKLSYIKEA